MRYRLLLVLFIILLFFIAFQSAAQPAEYKMTEQEYIDTFKDDAVKDMLMHGIPASITLAQAMLESGNGNSPLASYANNHFGIKCHNDWKGETYHQDDDHINECFRKYASVYDSYADHSDFLKSKQRYAFLFELKPTDYKGWAKGLKEAGYATDPDYTEKLLELIDRNSLTLYDQVESIPRIQPQPKLTKKNVKHTLNHEIELFNNIKTIIIKEGDNLQNIANELEIEIWQLLKYNDLSKTDKLVKGQRLYLQPKRKKFSGKEFHIAKQGETMKSISQQYGVKLKHLYKNNLLKPGTEPKAGEKVYLKKKRVDRSK